ncbi:MAG: D-xylose reductase [Arenicella sp.]|jgi:D-xylose reductase
MNQMSSIPKIGFGLWKVPKQSCAEVVYQAIKTGYRHLDSASDYGNEVEVGNGIARAINDGLCSRDELWVTSKLWNTYHAPDNVGPAIQRTLNDLQLDYLDLYLIHFPIALAFVPFEQRYPAQWLFDTNKPELGMQTEAVSLSDTWFAMEKLIGTGQTRQIGICNYNTGLLQDLLNYARIKPAMLQIESHPYLAQEKLIRLCQLNHIPVTAFSPLGALSYLELEMANQNESVLQQSVVKAAAQRLNKTPAQVVLRWGIQRGTAIIPKTSKPERLLENLNILDFSLSESEMNDLNKLNANRRFNDPGIFCEKAFNTFFPIYD